MGRVTKKSFLNITPSDIGKMKAHELRELLRGVRNLYQSQEKTFDKYNGKVWSPALEKMQSFYDETGEKAVSRMNVNQMRSELFRLQDFLGSKTSTVPGARKVLKEQDIRIFGEDSRGRPKKRLTVEQRTRLWSAYQEFVGMHPNINEIVEGRASERIQQYLGEMIIGKKGSEINMADFEHLYQNLISESMESDWERSGYDYEDFDTLSGTRPY